MNRIAMSAAASGLLRALIARAGVPRDRILLTDLQSVEWRSLTFAGERHRLDLRIPGSGSRAVMDRMCAGVEDFEFAIPGIVVADVGIVGTPCRAPDGSTCFTIEALTVTDD